MDTSVIAICGKTAYRCRVTFGVPSATIHIMQCLLENKTELSLINKTLVSQSWEPRIQRGSLPKLQTATKEPLDVEGNILLHVRFESLFARVWFGVMPDLEFDMLLITSFINRFVHGIFPSKCKVVPWHSHSVTIRFTNHYQKPASSKEVSLIPENKLCKHVEKSAIAICIARKVVLEPHTQHSVLVTTSATGIHTVKPRTLEKRIQMLSAAYCVVDIFPFESFYILLSNFSAKAMNLPKQMVVEHALDPSTAAMTPRPSRNQ